MEMHHFNHHDHPLMFKKEHNYDVNGRVWCCDGCELPIFPGNPLYSCSRHGCEFKLHKVCAKLPIEIKEHPMHSNHPLTLLSKPNYEISTCGCAACNGDWGKFTYNCSLCGFDLDIFCAVPSIMAQGFQFKRPKGYTIVVDADTLHM